MGDESSSWLFRIDKGVPVLRANHFTIQAILFGVREVV